MLKKRIIPCLDVKNGHTVKGTNFVDLRDAGDPVELAAKYAEEGADELVFLDITATNEKRKTVVALVDRVAREVNIPFTVGGGVSSVEDVYAILRAGADKVAVNSAVVKRPILIKEIAQRYGSQCLVVAMDARWEYDRYVVYVGGGRVKTELELFEWARIVQKMGAGEILFTSMDHDGTKDGFACDALAHLSEIVTIPVIASGGAGKSEDFEEVFTRGRADAALAASVFHYKEIAIPKLKEYLSENNIAIRL